MGLVAITGRLIYCIATGREDKGTHAWQGRTKENTTQQRGRCKKGN